MPECTIEPGQIDDGLVLTIQVKFNRAETASLISAGAMCLSGQGLPGEQLAIAVDGQIVDDESDDEPENEPNVHVQLSGTTCSALSEHNLNGWKNYKVELFPWASGNRADLGELPPWRVNDLISMLAKLSQEATTLTSSQLQAITKDRRRLVALVS